MLMIGDIAQELYFAAQQRRRDIRPRIKRAFSYALVRAWGTVIQRDLQVAAVIGDLYAGRPVGYTTFLAYDEVAHHSGVERVDALATLRRVDRQIARIAAAAADAPRPYHLVVLSDHGQSQGATFLDRYGITPRGPGRRGLRAPSASRPRTPGSDESLGYLGASLTEASGSDGVLGRGVRAATRGKRGRRRGPARRGATEAESEDGEGEQPPELSVMASGCLGLISFPREPGRVSLERIERALPGADAGAARASRDRLRAGPLRARRGRRARRRAAPTASTSGEVEGEDPLAPFGPNAAHHVRRTDGFAHCPDIVLNSTYWAETDEVAAFEELVGSHGGMGGEQSYPFALAPERVGDARRAGRRRRGDAPAHAALARRPRPRGVPGYGWCRR